LGSLILFASLAPTKFLKEKIYRYKDKIFLFYTVLLSLGFIAILLLPNMATTIATNIDLFIVPLMIFLFALMPVLFLIRYKKNGDKFLLYLAFIFSLLINAGITKLFYKEWDIIWWYFHIILVLAFLLALYGLIKSKEESFYSRISNRIWVIVWIGVIILLSMSVMSLNSLQQLNKSFEDLQKEAGELNYITSLQITFNHISIDTHKYTHIKDDILEGSEIQKHFKDSDIYMSNLDKLSLGNLDKREIFLSIQNPYIDIKQSLGEFIALNQNNVIDQTEIKLLDQKISELVRLITSSVHEWRLFSNREIDEAESSFLNLIKEVSTINYLLMLIFVIYVLLSGFIVFRWTVRPINRLTETAQKIAGGNTKIRADITSRDEIGVLSSSFNKMTDGLVSANKKFKENNLRLVIKIMEEEELTKNLENTKTAMLNILDDLKVEKNKVEREMENSKKFYQAVEASTDGIIITDINANIVYANPSWVNRNGYTLYELIGKNPRILKSGKTPQKIYDDMWSKLSIGESFITEELVNKRKDGTEYTQHESITPIMVDDKILFYLGISQDVTKRKEIDKLKSEFVAVASHQLRTPLTSIRWVIELFLKKEKLTKQGKEYLNDVQTSTEKLSELVDLLLNVSRIEEGDISITPKKLDIVNFIENYIKELNPLLNKKKLTISFKHPEKLSISTDESALRNVIQSIISNAVEYTLPDGKIEIKLSESNNEFYIDISDTGIGIPENQQKNITQKFTRGSNAMLVKTDGTGMGLYIAYHAVGLLGGEIWFESKENSGTTFHIKLPIESKIKKGEKKMV